MIRVIQSVVALVQDESGQILLNTPSPQGPWALIGGEVLEGEELAAAAKRHALKDADLTIETSEEICQLVGEKYQFIYECGADQTWIPTVLRCKILSTNEGAPLKTKWFSLKEIEKLYLDEFATTALKDLQELGAVFKEGQPSR